MNINKTIKINMLKAMFLTFFGFFIVTQGIVAQEQEAEQSQAEQPQAEQPHKVQMTPDEAVEMAIKNNLLMESSRIDLSTRRRASHYSWNQFIPNVTASGTISRSNQPNTTSGLYPIDMADLMNPMLSGMGIPPMPPETLYGVTPYSVDLPRSALLGSLQASLNLNVAMFENMIRLRKDYQAGQLSYEKTKAQLERDVRKAYHNILLIQENINLLQGSFDNAQRQVDIAQANYNAGRIPELTLLQAQVVRENLRPVIDQADNGLKLSMAQFAYFLGLDYDTEFDLIPVAANIDYMPLDVVELVKEALEKKPDIKELRQTILMLKSAHRATTYGALTPFLNLSYNYNPIFMGDPANDSWFGSGSEWSDRGSFSVTLGMRLHSLIPFSPDFQGIINVSDQIKSANVGLEQMIYGTEIEIYNIVLSLERTRTTAEAMLETIHLAERSYQLTEQAYQAGLQDYFQVQSAEQSWHQARVQMLEQQFNYLNGLIDLEYSIGVPFGTLSQRD